MSQFFNHIFTLLTTPPGNLIYRIVLVVAVAVTLQRAIGLLRSTQFPQVRRTVIGLGILLVLQGLLLIGGIPTSLGWVDPGSLLPTLDRAITLLSLVWIIWLWVFPEPGRLADYATLLLNILILVLFGLTLAFWTQNPGGSYNLTGFETIWQGASLAVAALGVLFLEIRKPNGWVNGLVILLLAFTGHLVSLAWRMDGNFPGVVRLAQMIMFPFLLTLLQRFPTTAAQGIPVPRTDADAPGRENLKERRRYSTDPKTFHALMSLAAELNSQGIDRNLTHGIARAMLADLCFLVTLTEEKSLYITCGYDLIREENLEGAPLPADAIPLLANAIQRGRPLRLPDSSTSADLKALGQMLSLNNPGNLLSVPIVTPAGEPLGGILILSPYSNRLWTAEDQDFISNVSSLFIPILQRGQRAALLEKERDQAQTDAQTARDLAEQSKKEKETVSQELDKAHDADAQSRVKLENLGSLMVMHEESQKTIDSLKSQIEQLQQTAQAADVPGKSAQIEALLAAQEESRQTIESLNTQLEQMRLSSEAAAVAGDSVQVTELLVKQDESQKTIDALNAQIEQMRQAAEVNVSSDEAVQINALLAKQEEYRKMIESLETQVEQMRQTGEISDFSGDSTQLELELHNALEELAQMQTSLAEANAAILRLQERPSSPITSEQVDVIASISQELRQPMSSIIGYTDLLMGESVGVLGSLQRKFIERIKSSTDRIGGLVNDLIQITNLETGKMEFKAESIDLNLIIDNAMAYTSAQIREKNITLRLDIPDSSLLIRTDRDAFQQILIHLLQNATGATQVEGSVTLRVQIQSEANEHFISIQVTDTGGGIASNDISRVFARRYHADHSLIQGLGDTGVGLSIAKALVEAQGGRIWVDTEPGSGSTFSILLPVLLKAEEEKEE